MSTQTSTRATGRRTATAERCPSCEAAAVRVYEAEVALHHARQTGVDAWVAAAYDKLHDAIAAHRLNRAVHDLTA